MAPSAADNSGETDQLLQRAAQGDRTGWGTLLERHRKRLRRMIANPAKWRQYQHARTVLTRALNPFDAAAHFLLGRELLDERKAAAAYPHLTCALTFQPGFGAAHVERAKAAFNLKRWAEAVADVDVVLRDQPNDADTLALRGQAYQNLGRPAEAVADFTTALVRSRGKCAGLPSTALRGRDWF